MRFLMRSLAGLMLAALTIGLLGLAVGVLRQAAADREAAAGDRGPGSERVYAVSVATLAPETATPVLTAYGDVSSARELELRAATSGTLTELAAGFRDGGAVAAGEVLWRIDPADARAALALAENDVAAARAEEAEAAVALELAREELAAAERQRDLRRQSRDRSDDLSSRGVGTTTDLETAEIALSTAEQTLAGRRMALAQAEARIERAAIARARTVIARDEAERSLDDTVARAPFAGRLVEVAAVPGRLVSENEQLGVLLDPAALEVAFRLSNAEFARLTDGDGGAQPLPITAVLDIGGIALDVPGVIDRASAAVGEGATGRLVYARLDPAGPGLVRPGDFLTVRIEEPPLENVAVVPATAVSPDRRIFLVGSDDRIEAVEIDVLRRDGDAVVIGGAPFGRTFVTERLPQIGPGVRVRPVLRTPEASARAVTGSESTMVRLSPERRAGLIAAVEANERLPKADRARLLAALEAEAVPQAMLDRLEPRQSGG